jgi:beta-glucosidase
MRHKPIFTIAVAFALLPSLPAGVAQESCSNRQTQQQIDRRIDELIAQMTVDERIAQLQDRAPAIPRLGLPAYNWWNEGLHGIARNGFATVFPQAIGLAATWDPALLRAVGDTVSTEARAKFNSLPGADALRYQGLTIWSPNINIFRDPRWGRGQETYGEDPFLTASLGKQFVAGIQGDDRFYLKADATPKHFVAHSGPEEGRDAFNAEVTPHDLADTYLSAFHALTQAGAAAMMCSYNEVNGTPMCANPGLLQTRVRDAWGFSGYVVSDCDAVGNITGYHHYTADAAHGAAAALNAGVDLNCGHSYSELAAAVAQKLVSTDTIDKSLHRLLLARVHLGLLDPAKCSPYRGIGIAENDTPAHRALALRAAEESIVLLRNDGTLPLKPSSQSVAVIGPTADMLQVVEANYHGTASHPVTALDGIREIYRNVRYAQGSMLATGTSAPIPRNALHLGPAANSAEGLTAEYFNQPSLDGLPVLTTTVPRVDFDINRAPPDPRIHADHFAARWKGWLLPPAVGEYVLSVNVKRCWDCVAHDSFRLLLDGKPLIENDGSKAEPNRATLHFGDTSPHSLQVELLHRGEDEGIALEWEPPADALLAQAIDAARRSDVILAFVGLSPELEGEALPLHLDGFAGGDRTSLALPASQRLLLDKLQLLHKPTVIVLNSGSAVALDAPASAVLAAWYPGEEGGHAIADVLAGVTNPSGRLPVTFYRSAADLPAFSDYSMEHRSYRYYQGPVLYPFGFGLSYTHFQYSAPILTRSTIKAGQELTATVNLRNTGAVPGTEVAELYLVPPQTAGAPQLALQGMQRVTLKPGESRQVTFTLSPMQISFVDPSGLRAVRSGAYRLYIVGSQPDMARDPSAGFHIEGEQPIDF